MPEISRFMGMIIKMIFLDNEKHHKPHVHVYYGDFEASIGIDGELLAGSLPVKQLKIITRAGSASTKMNFTQHGIMPCAVFTLIRLNPLK